MHDENFLEKQMSVIHNCQNIQIRITRLLCSLTICVFQKVVLGDYSSTMIISALGGQTYLQSFSSFIKILNIFFRAIHHY